MLEFYIYIYMEEKARVNDPSSYEVDIDTVVNTFGDR